MVIVDIDIFHHFPMHNLTPSVRAESNEFAIYFSIYCRSVIALI